MAKSRSSYVAWLALFLILTSCCCGCDSSSSSSSWTSHHPADHQILDVSASLQIIRHVFSPKSPISSMQQQLNVLTNNHSLTLTLHPLCSLPFAQSHANNYTALTLSRLARDQAHVRSRFSTCTPYTRSRHGHSRAHSRHRNSHAHSKRRRSHAHSRQRSRSKYYRSLRCQAQLQSPVISGISLGSGEYFARIGFGRPVRELYLILDTGSDVTWIQCQPCASCYNQSDPIFNPSASSTYRNIPCHTAQCNAAGVHGCGPGGCLYQVSYGDNSYTVGNLATETFSFGETGSASNVIFGCGHENEGLFSGSAGLLGVGNGPLSLPTQIKATSFSYCLVRRDSSSYSTLEFNSTPPPDSVLAPMVINPMIKTYFYVDVAGIDIGGLPVRIPQFMYQIQANGEGGVIIDSGTAVSRFRPEVYAIVRDTFRSMTRHLPPADEFSLFDTCYDLSSVSSVRVPTFSYRFSNGQTLALQPNNYVIPVSPDGRFCFAFAATMGPTAIIGNVQQQGTRVTYDLAKRHIAFSQNKC